ncbi:DUF445 domain-containing protein [Niabella sp. CC-SYL272]|uniref:DUF445 domain-containing protein n=1 Tax=Niabella agricola TaxID=2891571 RepID=UPI001F3D1664|nr:DUF445 domain-containing protein [Niabella agricola]MCF3109139.1 DUF445 domain-containing protein [Niabella agricola]
MNNEIKSADAIKAAQLKKHKALATGLFLLMALVFLGCVYLLKSRTDIWIGYVKAFAEAAMVGALADWFAVTALFHHPMGLPIPHTNLIENSKKRIGDNLGNFVVSNFLNAKTLRPYIERLELSSVAAAWLVKAQHVQLLVTEASRLLKRMIETSDAQLITGFIARKAGELLDGVRLNEVVANGLGLIVERGDHERVLNFVLGKVRNYVIENEALVKQRVKEGSHFLIPGFVNNYIATKLTAGIANYLQEIEKDPQHKIRKDFNKQLLVFAETLKTSPEWQRDLESLKNDLLTPQKLEQYAGDIWKRLQAHALQDLSSEDSALRRYFKKSVEELAANLQQDAEMRTKIDRWIRYNAYHYILRNTKQAGALISNTVGNWEGKELSNKLELEVGKDLQFIRINGTLVGGIVGLLIYTISRLL